MVRRVENWIAAFSALFGKNGAPEIFRTWAGIATIAGVLERRVFVDVGLGPLYPNLYTVLVAPPGIGKTQLTSKVEKFWLTLSTGNSDGLHVAPASMTAASVIDALKDAERKFYDPKDPIEPLRYNTLNVCSNEFGTLLPAYDPDMMNRLTDIYDGHPYSERRRTKEIKFKIDHPQINILAATTPGHLANAMPEGAWDQGFLSRTILVFNSERTLTPLFEKPVENSTTEKELIADLRHIFGLSGEFKFTPEAAEAINKWHMEGGPPTPDHPRLRNYVTRRTSHLLKLCMIASASSSDARIITIEHLHEALGWLVEAEVMMPDIFKALVVNADMKAMDECWHFAFSTFLKEGNRPIAEHRLVAFLQERVPVQNVLRMLQVMQQANILTKEIGEDNLIAYRPKPKKGGR